MHCVKYFSHLLAPCISKCRYYMRPSLALNLWPLKTLIFMLLEVPAGSYACSLWPQVISIKPRRLFMHPRARSSGLCLKAYIGLKYRNDIKCKENVSAYSNFPGCQRKYSNKCHCLLVCSLKSYCFRIPVTDL